MKLGLFGHTKPAEHQWSQATLCDMRLPLTFSLEYLALSALSFADRPVLGSGCVTSAFDGRVVGILGGMGPEATVI